MWYVIVGLVWVSAVLAIGWNYRRRQQQRNAERAKHVGELLAQAALVKAGLVTGSAMPSAAPALAVAADPVAEVSRKPRLLPQPVALLYYVFRTGLPDHEIFAFLTLDDVLDIAPGARAHLPPKLPQRRLDLVICDRQLNVVAVVVAGAAQDPMAQRDVPRLAECLERAGIRFVRIDAAAPPRHHQVRALVYGGQVPA